MGGGGKETEFNRRVAGQMFRTGEYQPSPEGDASPRQADVYTHRLAKGAVFTTEQSVTKEGESKLSRAGQLLWESKSRKLSGAEKRAAVQEMVVERPDLKYWQIGKELGSSNEYHSFFFTI